jgi:hypothetical protein
LSRLSTSFVLGYHGCDKSTGESVLGGASELKESTKDYDWLGPGVYFWESDPRRALEWAKIRGYRYPYVIGAVIDLRNCLDLLTREDLETLHNAYTSFIKIQELANLPIPKNLDSKSDPNSDLLLRYLDCAVIKHLHEMLIAQSIEPYDSIRGMFQEDDRLYETSGFRKKSHVQIAVRNPSCIKGFFVPRPYPILKI